MSRSHIIRPDQPAASAGLGSELEEAPLPRLAQDQAQLLLARGIICVPLVEGGKHLDLAAMGYQPLHLATRRKALKELAFTAIVFELSQRPPAQAAVEQWFAGGRSNIGIVCGAAGLLVLDFDDKTAFERWRKDHEPLVAAAPRQETPKGMHVFLRCDTPTVSSSLHHGLRRVGHVKALGGYIAAAPSRIGDGSYRWAAGHSLFEREPQGVASLEILGLHASSPFKRTYDRLLGRGFFESR